jgi:hypothetical protein
LSVTAVLRRLVSVAGVTGRDGSCDTTSAGTIAKNDRQQKIALQQIVRLMVSVTDQETSVEIELATVFVGGSKHLTRWSLMIFFRYPKPTDVSSSMNRAAEVIT